MIIGGRAVNPGELRTRIYLESETVSAETGGFGQKSWSTLAAVWAKWKNPHGQESLQASLLGAEAPATVVIRYYAGLDRTCAVRKGTDRYEILSIDNIEERNEYMELKVRRMEAG